MSNKPKMQTGAAPEKPLGIWKVWGFLKKEERAASKTPTSEREETMPEPGATAPKITPREEAEAAIRKKLKKKAERATRKASLTEAAGLAEEVEEADSVSEASDVMKRAYETKLHKKYATEEEKAYARVKEAVERASRMLEEELKRLALEEAQAQQKIPINGKSSVKANTVNATTYRKQLLKYAKVAVKQIEEKNLLHVVAFRSRGQGVWWKLGGNSLAIYRMLVGTCLEREVNVNVDHDTFAVFKGGVICLKGDLRLEQDILYTGAPLTLDKSVDFGVFKDVIMAYRLRVPLAEREIRQFMSHDIEMEKMINNSIFSVTPEVDIQKSLSICLNECYSVERQLDSNARGFVAHPLIDSVFAMKREYYDVANLPKKSPQRREAMMRLNRRIGDGMTALANYSDLGIVNRSLITKASLNLAKLREQVEQKISRMEQRSEMKERLEQAQLKDEEVEER